MNAQEFIEKELLPFLAKDLYKHSPWAQAAIDGIGQFIQDNRSKWRSVEPWPSKEGYEAICEAVDKEPWFAESDKKVNKIGSAWDEFRKVNDARISRFVDKLPPIEPLSLPSSILPYKHGKVTGKDVLDMLLPVINKQKEIIVRLAEKGI